MECFVDSFQRNIEHASVTGNRDVHVALHEWLEYDFDKNYAAFQPLSG